MDAARNPERGGGTPGTAGGARGRDGSLYETGASPFDAKQSLSTQIQARLAGQQGPAYWRSLDELAQTAEFNEWLQREFPRGAAEWDVTLDRRTFLKLMGAAMALAGLTSCARQQPPEQIAPYVRQPESVIPGVPQYYATALSLGGFGAGVLVESHLGRPTKVEGNPEHPASLGATDIFAQAAPLTLYDPDRAQTPFFLGAPNTWENFLPMLNEVRARLQLIDGAGLRILSETVTSPTLAAQIEILREQFPQMVWHQYEPINRANIYTGAQLVFGELVTPQYNFGQADVILSLDADFLSPGPAFLRNAREFAARRFVSVENPAMNRLYVVESMPGLTGSMADHRLALPPGQIEYVARALAQELGVDAGPVPELTPAAQEWVAVVAADLQAHNGRSLVLAGPQQPPVVHALAHAVNAALNNVGQSVVYTAPVEIDPGDQLESLRELTTAMQNGEVEALFILEGNPAFTAPADIPFAANLVNVPFSVHLSMYRDETARLCNWLISATHTFEAWSDVRAFDGTISIVQPLIIPLYSSITAHELLAALSGRSTTSSLELIREFWRAQQPNDFELFWRTTLARGLIPATEVPQRDVTPELATLRMLPVTPAGEGLTILFAPDPTIWDGRFANNGWLQELPEPITKITWDNAAMLSPATALRLGLANEQLVELRLGDYTQAAAIWVVPGMADDTVGLHLGYGRTAAGRVGTDVGFNAYKIRTSDAFWFGNGLEIVPLSETYSLATTQNHHTLEGRDLIRVGTKEQFIANPDFAQHADALGHQSLFEEYEYPQAWGMSVNLNTCIGCNACTIACQAENNIPIVGKEGVIRGREMHWIRVDRYFGGDLDNPGIYHQPVPCMHCETAPCELVCPVAATVHDAWNGLNAMIYNRCVGTRYCSNNCPYKVRRFNFFDYVNEEEEQLKLMRNPDVTVRSRGVMEKCTYCVQRINRARIEAETTGVPLDAIDVVTACAQVCPTQAITFGDLKDPASLASRLRGSPLTYGLLTELNTRPRTTYMAKLRNPNSALAAPGTKTE